MAYRHSFLLIFFVTQSIFLQAEVELSSNDLLFTRTKKLYGSYRLFGNTLFALATLTFPDIRDKHNDPEAYDEQLQNLKNGMRK